MSLELVKSKELFREAQEYIPGGVNSPVRAFKAVGCTPVFIQRAKGSRIYDEDGNSYIDYVGSWGPMILGHAHPAVVQAIQEAASRGTSYGAPTALEIKLARMIREALPTMELVRLVNSGTEATMSAIRVARGYTGRDKIIKFEGCYHGHADNLLVSAGSGATTLGVPNSPGVPKGAVEDTIVLPYNDLEAVERTFSAYPDQIAAVIVEPVAGNMGVVPPREGYLQGLRELTRKYGAVLIFDEVMTGFRVAYGGAQILYGIEPDLTCLGKIIGGGLPLAAYGGKKEIMSKVAPAGPVYQAGTLSGNPLAVSAGIATLGLLQPGKMYQELTNKTRYLAEGLARVAEEAGISVRVNAVGAMFSVFFTSQEVVDYASAKTSDTQAFAVFFRLMLAQGIYLAPSQFEALFLSTAHSNADLEVTIGAARLAMKKLAQGEDILV